MMKFDAIIVLTLLLVAQLSFGQNPNTAPMNSAFKIPNDWQRSGPTLFLLKDVDQQRRFWEKELAAGHQAWRLDPLKVAAVCLLDFGIENGSPVQSIADRLVVQKPGEEFVLLIGSKTYTVYIKTAGHVPLAYKLTVKPEGK